MPCEVAIMNPYNNRPEEKADDEVISMISFLEKNVCTEKTRRIYKYVEIILDEGSGVIFLPLCILLYSLNSL